MDMWMNKQTKASLSASDKVKSRNVAGVAAVLRDGGCLSADGAAWGAFAHRSCDEQRKSVLTHAQSAERPSHGSVGPTRPLPACPAARCRTPPYTCEPLLCLPLSLPCRLWHKRLPLPCSALPARLLGISLNMLPLPICLGQA